MKIRNEIPKQDKYKISDNSWVSNNIIERSFPYFSAPKATLFVDGKAIEGLKSVTIERDRDDWLDLSGVDVIQSPWNLGSDVTLTIQPQAMSMLRGLGLGWHDE